MNLSLQQALKYGTKEDLIASAVNSPELDPTHLLIAADAFEESGEEGMADVLRLMGTKRLVPSTDWSSEVSGPYFRSPTLTGWVDKSQVSGEDKPLVTITSHLNVSGSKGGGKGITAVVSPQEAKEATARLPNAEEIHQFIDQHFPEQKPAD